MEVKPHTYKELLVRVRAVSAGIKYVSRLVLKESSETSHGSVGLKLISLGACIHSG